MGIMKYIQTSGGTGSATVFKGTWLTATDYLKNQQVALLGDLYLCIVSHTSGATTQPGTGASWTDKWARQIDSLTVDEQAACAGEGTPSASNKFATKTYIDLISLCITATAGETLSQYNVVYAKSDGKYWKADADTSITTADACGIVLQSGGITANATGSIQVKPGYITNGSWTFTPHTNLYLGLAGAIVESATARSNTKPLGYAETATQIYWNPQTGWSNTELVSGLSPDQLSITFIPANYTRTVVPSCTTTAQLAAHLDGLDLAIKALADRLTAHGI